MAPQLTPEEIVTLSVLKGKGQSNTQIAHTLGVSEGAIRIEAAGAGSSKVTWSNGGDLGMNPVGRYFGLFMDRMMGPDFQSGLEKLKSKVETKG